MPKRNHGGRIFLFSPRMKEKNLSRSGKAQSAGDFPHGRDAKVDVFVERHT
jgi:hypothetical protein